MALLWKRLKAASLLYYFNGDAIETRIAWSISESEERVDLEANQKVWFDQIDMSYNQQVQSAAVLEVKNFLEKVEKK